MSLLDDFQIDGLTGVPMRRKKAAPELSPAEIVAAAIDGLRSAVSSCAEVETPPGITADQIDQIVRGRDEFWAEQINKMTTAIVQALSVPQKPGKGYRLVPEYENGDRIVHIDLVPGA